MEIGGGKNQLSASAQKLAYGESGQMIMSSKMQGSQGPYGASANMKGSYAYGGSSA
jgi:hypothetical protein